MSTAVPAPAVSTPVYTLHVSPLSPGYGRTRRVQMQWVRKAGQVQLIGPFRTKAEAMRFIAAANAEVN